MATIALTTLLSDVPAIRLGDIERELPGSGIYIVAHMKVSGRRHTVVCEVKSDGQPRNVRMAVHQLRSYVADAGRSTTPMVVAPYLSPEAQAVCRENGVGFLDLEGNARLVFDGVFIERLVATKPVAQRRDLKSLFKPKAGRVLRAMLRDPARPWRVTELAEMAEVSLGHVSNVRTALVDKEWAQISDNGLFLSRPDAVLDAWREVYEAPVGKELRLYTTLHGSILEKTARRALGDMPKNGHGAFASFSAAQWLAPYGRTSTHYFYANSAGLEHLKIALRLEPADRGENIVVRVVKDDGVFRDTVEPAPGAVCTGLVQTYLDLWAAGERGRESADHLRREKLKWPH